MVYASPTVFSGTDGEEGDFMLDLIRLKTKDCEEIQTSELYEFRYSRIQLSPEILDRLK